MTQRTAVLLGGPCDLTRMALPPNMGCRPNELRMPTMHSAYDTFGWDRPSNPTRLRVQVYVRTMRCAKSATEVFEWSHEECS